MAQHTEVILTDDLDGTEFRNGKDETVAFGLDGKTYETVWQPWRSSKVPSTRWLPKVAREDGLTRPA